MRPIEQLQPSESHRLVPVESFRIVPGIVSGTWVLVVEGTAPCANMIVSLEPAVYVRQPEWWRIEAVGAVPGGICLTAVRPYSATLPLAGVTGTEGIELVGQDFCARIEVPPKDDTAHLERVLQVSQVSLAMLKTMPPRLVVTARGTASTPGWTDARLQLRPWGGTPPADGIVDFDFLADPPDGPVIQVLAPISASTTWTDYGKHYKWVKGVRVHAKTNAVEALLVEPAPGPSVQKQVDLPQGQTVAVPEAGLTLRLDAVEDSRCPSNVVCIWQGFVKAILEATPDGEGPQRVELSTLDTEPAVLPSGHRLSLVNVMPYPVAGAEPPHDPIATVVVMRP